MENGTDRQNYKEPIEYIKKFAIVLHAFQWLEWLLFPVI